MREFFRENSDNIIKLFVNQIGMTIFGLLLSVATFQNKELLMWTGVLTVIFYLYLVYSTAWYIGAKDKIKIDGGRMNKSPVRGLILGTLANSINIILALVIILCYYTWFFSEMQWAANITAIAYQISWLLNGMYIAILSPIKIIPLRYFLMLICVIPSILTSGVAYFAGIHNFRILSLFGFNPNKK